VGLESGIKLGLWGVFLMLSISLFIIAWGYFIGADAVTFCIFLIILVAVVFPVIFISGCTKKLSRIERS